MWWHTTKPMGPPQLINMLKGIVECSKPKYCWRWKKGGPKEVEASKWSWLQNNHQTFFKLCSLPQAKFKVKQICRMPCTLQKVICQFLQLKPLVLVDGVAIVSMHDFFKQKAILAMVTKILEEHVLFTLGQSMTIIVSFDF